MVSHSLSRFTCLTLTVAALASFVRAGEKKTGIAEKENEHYRMITLPTPPKVELESGELCFLGPDKLACSTRFGDIWIAEGVLADPPTPKWTLFARGLHEVLGLATR